MPFPALTRKSLSPLAAILIALLCSAIALCGAWLAERGGAALSDGELYALAVRDAAFIDEGEALPLVSLEKGAPFASWDETGERVLLLSWHGEPGSYPAGDDVAFDNREIWAFSYLEFSEWYASNKSGVSDWTARLEQLIGLPPESGCTHVSAFWVDIADVIRPAVSTDPLVQPGDDDARALEGALAEWYAAWFDANTLFSYFESAYPWTRLGYTYDWAPGCDEYGLSEFLILPGARATVEYTLTTDEFLRLADGRAA